jgi:hypothetical protein
MEPLRPLELLAALRAHGVEFVVIGGFSLAAHGYVRGTKDVDIVPAPDSENLRRLAAALADLEAEIDLAEDFDAAELGIAPDADGLAFGGNWVLRTRLGRLDVMQDVPGVKGYDELWHGAVNYRPGDLDHDILFAGIDDLIRMKLAAGREQDRVDIAALEQARGQAG